MQPPFRGTTALAEGVLTRARLYGPGYRRILPDVYLPADQPVDLLTRARAASLWAGPRGGVVAGYSAAALHGADCAPDDAPAEVLVEVNTRAHPGLLIRRGRVDGRDLRVVDGIRVTSAERTAWDLARRLPLVEAVVAVDALSRADARARAGAGGGTPFRPADLLVRREASPRAPGSRGLGAVVELADPRAGSPPETRLRVALVRAGLPRPRVRHRVDDAHGVPVARVDLAYPEVKLAVRYDGASRLDPDQVDRDREQDLVLAGEGWQTLRFGPADLRARARTVSRVARQLELRAALLGARLG